MSLTKFHKSQKGMTDIFEIIHWMLIGITSLTFYLSILNSSKENHFFSRNIADRWTFGLGIIE